MKQTVKITGLDCANCAKTLEKEINKIDGVENAKIDFVHSKLSFESENCDKALTDIINLTKQVEPDVKIESKNKSQKRTIKKQTVKILGLDCANCAKTLEKEINKIDSVENAKIDFVHSKLSFESEDCDKALTDIINLTKQVESDAKIENKNKSQKKINNKLIVDFAILFLGIAIGVLCVLNIAMPKWLFWTLFVASALLLGYKTYIKAIKLLLRGVVNENLLITISVIGASIIGKHMEALMVVALYSLGKILEGMAVDKSRKSIEKLTNLEPEYAVVVRDGKEAKVSPKEVQIGETIVVRPGERVPIDGKIVDGSATLDMQSLTGESLLVSKNSGDEILSGSIVKDGILKIETTGLYENSTVSKILNLIENASEKKSKTETVISKVASYYTIAVVVLSIVVGAIVWAVSKNFDTALYRGLIFLVISCPCAFAISVPLSYFSGLGNASKNGILIKGSNYLDACAKLNVVAFDKTGTLTTGVFKIDKIESFDENRSQEDILWLTCLGEQNSLHPVAKSILAENTKQLQEVQNFKEIAGKGVEFEYQNAKYFVGRAEAENCGTSVVLFENEKKIGQIYLSDAIKDSTKPAIANLKSMGIKTVLLSGDNEKVAQKVGADVGIDTSLGKLLPEDKYHWIEQEKGKKGSFVGYVGDGINDAPSLMLADVGISMGINGSQASIEASDVVLVDDNPQKVATAIKISKYTRKIVWQNIGVSAIVKATFLILGALGVTGMLYAVFADVGVTLLAVLNSMRALYYKTN